MCPAGSGSSPSGKCCEGANAQRTGTRCNHSDTGAGLVLSMWACSRVKGLRQVGHSPCVTLPLDRTVSDREATQSK
eukprot:CAMPEP_0179205682 /NCGR_PEP_ID=MMETSP0796-20121207/102542_1 /TAXON_ID=73915 /ORGANISM="Pyrodinium bahamense, Strain pbaha01" /LENGTH=75 /DNA_ID=CAMNT_0020910573 /DNA_START=734 /DNA_END=961 /DNA_ORIENTATION=-